MKSAQVDHGYGVALTIGHIGVFAIGRSVIRQTLFAKIPPRDPREDGQQDNGEEEFSQEFKNVVIIDLSAPLSREDRSRSGLSIDKTWSVHRTTYHRSDLPDLLHQFVELIGIKRLDPVRKSFVRIAMHFHDQAVGADCNRSAGQRRNFVALSGAMARVDNDWQMAESLNGGNDAQV